MKVRFTREQWLQNMASIFIRELFNPNGYKVPERIRVSCGLPSKRAFTSNRKVVGQCWNSKNSKDGHFEIFISPTISDSVEVAHTLLHEMIHAVVGIEAGHRKPFSQCARKLGLTGKMTASEPNEKLTEQLKGWVKESGNYPHAELDYQARKKQTTRMLKIECINEDCSYFLENEKKYIVRMSATVYDYAAPVCGCCGEEMTLAE